MINVVALSGGLVKDGRSDAFEVNPGTTSEPITRYLNTFRIGFTASYNHFGEAKSSYINVKYITKTKLTLPKGTKVYVQGSLVLEQWTDQNGLKRDSLYIQAKNVDFLAPNKNQATAPNDNDSEPPVTPVKSYNSSTLKEKLAEPLPEATISFASYEDYKARKEEEVAEMNKGN